MASAFYPMERPLTAQMNCARVKVPPRRDKTCPEEFSELTP